jgi:hypothetical protein
VASPSAAAVERLPDAVQQVLKEHRIYYETIQQLKRLTKFTAEAGGYSSPGEAIVQLQGMLAGVLDCEHVYLVVYSNEESSYYMYKMNHERIVLEGAALGGYLTHAPTLHLERVALPSVFPQARSLLTFPILNRFSRAFVFALNKKDTEFESKDKNMLQLFSRLSIGRLVVRLE